MRSPLGSDIMRGELVVDAKDSSTERQELCYDEEHVGRDIVVRAYDERGKCKGDSSDE